MFRIRIAAVVLLCLNWAAVAIAQVPQPESRIDYALWEKYRHTVEHPCTTVKKEDLQRARENIERYDWARSYRDGVCQSADAYLRKLTPDFVERMIEPTTPGAMGPCPACRAKGLPWHPNGQWNWSPARPDQITCAACGTVFPHDEFPEDVVVQCTWGRGQTFTFIGGDTFKCFGYLQARPCLSGNDHERHPPVRTGVS